MGERVVGESACKAAAGEQGSGEAGGGMMPGMHEDGAERGRKRPESDDEDEDAENKHLRMMTADEQRRYLRENHSQIEKRRRDKMNTHIKVNIAKVFSIQ